MRRLLIGTVTAAIIAAAAAIAVPSTATAAPCTGTAPIQITSLAFSPAKVAPGQSSVLTLVAQNCTNQAVNANSDWSGVFSGPSTTDTPAGCGDVAGLPMTLMFPAGGQLTTTRTYSVPAACTATDLAATVKISSASGTVQQTAHLAIGSSSVCTGTAAVQINSIAFNPTTVSRGQSSTATAVVQNCTNQALTLSSYWYGMFTSPPATGIAAGCPAVDPYPVTPPLSLPANGKVSVTSTWQVATSCTATNFALTFHVSAPDGTSVNASTNLTITQSSGAPCAVSYQRQSEWANGFVASITFKNNSAASMASWTLLFAFPGDQQITNAWNATVTQAGNQVTARSPLYSASVAAGASYTFGFQGTWHTSDASPTAFTLNGSPCTTV